MYTKTRAKIEKAALPTDGAWDSKLRYWDIGDEVTVYTNRGGQAAKVTGNSGCAS